MSEHAGPEEPVTLVQVADMASEAERFADGFAILCGHVDEVGLSPDGLRECAVMMTHLCSRVTNGLDALAKAGGEGGAK